MDADKRVELSVVIPCLNEENTIGLCVEKINNVCAANNITKEVIVADNGSTDKSVEIASALGAKIVRESVRGYGAAYIAGLKRAKGNYIIIGDGDDTYDFYEIPRFLDLLRKGNELVMGSRFLGRIHKGAMPWLNRYVGNPILSGLCRLFFGTKLSDIHCGMRGLSRSGYEKLNLRCLGMEFATEMVMEALQKKLKITEIPIEYYPRKGRSKLQPLKDGWRHLRFMLLFCPSWLYLLPGFFLFGLGLLLMALLSRGPVELFGRMWDVHVLVLGSLLTLLGYQVINLGIYARTFAVNQGYSDDDKPIKFIMRHFTLETGIIIGAVFFLIGLGLNLSVVIEWWQRSFGPLQRIRESILAMTFMVVGIQTFFSSFFISLLVIKR